MTPATYTAIQAHIDGVDHVAREMEAKWGIGRLRLLVSADLRERFDRQQRRLNRAVWPEGKNAEPAEVARQAEAMIRGWRALDAAATAAGAQPLSPEAWETVTADGEVIAITRTNAEAAAVSREGRALRVYTVDEIGRLLSGLDLLHAAKAAFPGAKVERARIGPAFDEWAGDSLEGAL